MDKFVIKQSINPGYVPPKNSDNENKENKDINQKDNSNSISSGNNSNGSKEKKISTKKEEKVESKGGEKKEKKERKKKDKESSSNSKTKSSVTLSNTNESLETKTLTTESSSSSTLTTTNSSENITKSSSTSSGTNKSSENTTTTTKLSTSTLNLNSNTNINKSTQTSDSKLQQTLVSHFFQSGSNDNKPSYKYLFEKEAADREEEERKERERQEKERLLLEEKRKKLQKLKAEAKKKREAERRAKEEREWEEYLALQEKITKGVEIAPCLYLGSFLAAKNAEWLQEANIKKIVNVTSEVPSYYINKKDKSKDEEVLIINSKKNVDSFIVDDDEDLDDEIEEDEEDEDIELDDEEENDEENEENEENNDEEMKSLEEEKMDIEVLSNIGQDQVNKEVEKVQSNIENMKVKTSTDISNDTTITKSNDATDSLKTDTVTPNTNAIDSTSNDSNATANTINSAPNNEEIKLDIKYFRIPIADSSRSKIEQYFDEAIKFIIGDDDGTSNVLIHCKQGRSRSPTIVIAYLMTKLKWNLEKSFNHVASVSPKDLTVNDGFKQKLMDLELELFGNNSINFFDRSSRSTRARKSIISKHSNNKDIDDNSDGNIINIDDSNTTIQQQEESLKDISICEDDTSIIDSVKVVKKRKNLSPLDDESD